MQAALLEHLKTQSTTVCRAWKVLRKDGQILGFTDHDCDLTFEDTLFRARSGLTAKALQTETGLSVDNTEAAGALTNDAINEADIAAGKYDSAEVFVWLVNWAAVDQRSMIFRGSFGEIVRKGNAFRVELRGLAERLNTSHGRAFVPECSAKLGDLRCKADLSVQNRTALVEVLGIHAGREVIVADDGDIPTGWFSSGYLRMGSNGPMVKILSDQIEGETRRLRLWEGLSGLTVGEQVILEAGCNGTSAVCQGKFGNLVNFRGFPSIPGQSWLQAPIRAGG